MATVTETAAAKSLYVLSDLKANPQPLQAYDIGADGTLAFQAEYEIPQHRLGAVGLAIDSDNGQLFVTYEMSENIELVDAKTMGVTGSVLAPDASNLAGIVYDHHKGLLYCVDRLEDFLYVYSWEPSTQTLSQVDGSPFTLRGSTAYGIALDEVDDILYVANGTKKIYAYNTSTWSLLRQITVGRTAISIALDVKNGYLYSGGGYKGNHYLTQYHLVSNTEKEVEVDPEAGVIGLAVDTDTGLVYMSTGNDTIAGGDDILVYDKSLKKIDEIPDIGNPTGLVVPGKNIGYNPLNLVKKVTDGSVGNNDLGEIQSVGAGGLITYSICFDNLENDSLTDLIIVDTLPGEVSFVSADEDGNFGEYDPITHTYVWLYPSLIKGTTACLDLTVQVNGDIEPGIGIKNYVTINSNQTPPTTTAVEVFTTSNPLHIKKSVVGAASDEIVKVNPGQEIIYRIHFGNNDNDFRATGISIVDFLPEGLSFVRADYDQTLGYYDSDVHAYIWRYPALEPGDATNVKLTAKVNEDIIPGSTLTNLAVIDSNETGETSSSVDVITSGTSDYFNLCKTVVGGVAGEVVEAAIGENVTYRICFDGNDIKKTIFNVSVIDTLPPEVTFVKADSEGLLGYYDSDARTYTWLYSYVSPGQVEYLELTVKINEDVPVGKIITNSVVIQSDETPTSKASVDIISVKGPEEPDEENFIIDANDLDIIPETIRRDGTLTGLTVVLKLPEGYKTSDVGNNLLVLSPVEFSDAKIEANSDQIVVEQKGRTLIVAVFDKNALMEAIPGYGQFVLRISGELVSGQKFYAEKAITITRFAGS
ncbi:MAG: DUF11 domain-containing protein [Sedimentisphaerales bacterium]|nr:DUF11 domain-containing protein [Sedimentisphaerales bacterium]